MGTYYVRDFSDGTIPADFILSNSPSAVVVQDGPGTINVHKGGDASNAPASSGTVVTSFYPKNHNNSDSSSASLTIVTEANGATISFYRRVQSESCCDFYRFSINGVQQEAISGNDTGWVYRTYTLGGAGSYTFQWSFSTDGSVLIGFSGYRITELEISDVSDATNPTKPAGSGGALGGSSGGSGVGNMFGGILLGETMLGGDPGPGTGGGNGYGNTSNMLGQFMFGEPMLGADPSNGSGTGQAVAGPSGSVYNLNAAVTGRTTVSGSMQASIQMRGQNVTCKTTVTGSLTQSSLRAGYVTCGTTVTGRLSTASYLTTQNITCKTTVTANLSKRIPPLDATAITCSTTVTGSLTRSQLRGQNIYSPMYVIGTLNLTPLQLRGEGVRGSTSLTARLGLARAFTTTSNISCGTSLTGNLTYSSKLSGGSVVDYTTVTGDLTRSYLRGTVSCGTTVTASSVTVRSAYTGTIHCGTTVQIPEGGFRRVLYSLQPGDVQTVACGTTVKGRIYVTPLDFVPIYLNTSTRITANLGLRLYFGSSALSNFIHGKTTVTGYVRGLQTVAGVINGKTTVTGKAKAGFGGDVIAYGYVIGAMGVRYLLTNTRVSKIQCKTTVVVGQPFNGTSGHAWGGTRFAYTYGTPDSDIPNHYDYTYTPPLLIYGKYIGGDRTYDYGGYNGGYYSPHFPTLGLSTAIKTNTCAGSTRLRSLIVPSRAWAHNHKGDPPYYGPYGSVSLYISPKGDIGLGDFIDCQTVVTGTVLALRHRLLQLFGATGLQAPGQIVFTGDAARGLGTKLVTGGPAVKILADAKPVKQPAYYV